MDLNGRDRQRGEDGRVRKSGFQHLAVENGTIDHESGVRMVFAMADKGFQGMQSPLDVGVKKVL